jgi:hypothetical protein
MRRSILLASLSLALMVMAGCSNWERSTYQSLAASQATINQVQADYETGTAIAHNASAYKAINSAKAAQTLAVNTFVAYEEVKAAGGTTASLTALETDVTVALAKLPTVIADVKALYTATGSK